MQIVFLALIFLCIAWIACIATFFLLSLLRIADKYDIKLPLFEDRKQKIEDAALEEERNDRYDKMLEQLSAEKTKQREEKRQKEEINYVYNELDELDSLETKESDPDELMKLLEFGIPDEEMEEILGRIETGSKGA